MRPVNPRWDAANRRWEASIGSGKNRKWFRCKIEGDTGRAVVVQKVEKYLHGPAPLKPGSLAEFVEGVWWPRTKAKCTSSTTREYKAILRRHVSKFYGSNIADIGLAELQAWVDGMDGSAKTIRNAFGVMSGILELARLTGKYPKNDHKLVVLPETERRWAVEGLEPANVERILAVAKGTVYEGPIWAAAFLGLRRNEICGLKKGHVRFVGSHALVSIQDNRQAHEETNKLKSKARGEARVIAVPNEMAEKLLSFGAGNDGLYVFHGERGGPIYPNKITKAMERFCQTPGVTPICFKDLRAACRSNLSAAGVPDVVIMQILGHSVFKTSLLYQDNRESRHLEAFARLTSKG